MLRTGFGAKTAKSLSSTGGGKQSVSDRGKGADSVIRAIAGSDIGTWLDADDIDVADGAAISAWSAKEGNGTDTQGNSDYRPTLDVDGLNSRPAVKFDNTDDFLGWAKTNLFASAMAANTVASVSTSANASSFVLELGDNNYHSKDGLVHGYLTDGSDANRFFSGMGEESGAEDSWVLSTKKGVPNLNNSLVSVYDRSTAPEDTLISYVSGEPTTNAVVQLSNTTTNAGWNDQYATLGARDGKTPPVSVPFNGHIRELIVLSRAITAGEAFRLGKALMSKSGLTKLLGSYS
jgi:hypothetical protein